MYFMTEDIYIDLKLKEVANQMENHATKAGKCQSIFDIIMPHI